MSSLYTENSEKWKSLASIDYFTQFVKAWIAFNAWYKNYYPQLHTDRKVIDEIKVNPNNFRNKLVSLLTNEGYEGFAFKSRIAELHLELEQKHIYNKGERITFEKIKIEENPQKQNNLTLKGITYKVEKNIPNRPSKEVNIYVIGKSGSEKFSYTQVDGYNLDDLISNNDFCKKLNSLQKDNLRACYEVINPAKSVNLLTHYSDNCIQMGNLHFIKDTDKICKGIIEILYKLRNVLFHGEIVPDSATNKVYEPAYHILYTLIQAL
ncbi:hypothetical protein L2E69_02205 [Planktothrix agardhii 1806]|jgi:hypothetical protein|uniref:hypothetical protein n=1 Tax=Planktothrix agardhii TaxID=1160 RepID=UPI001F2EE09A|nr:hypothetical protein [Planktothrix agardhii]MCF3604434.1 hypothetical protein [Planktothrix agardhii 1804]MCF3614760.1 hypothetical protein [Planktothrix agardhii 1806]